MRFAGPGLALADRPTRLHALPFERSWALWKVLWHFVLLTSSVMSLSTRTLISGGATSGGTSATTTEAVVAAAGPEANVIYDVAVIGAGLAGLTVARQLHNVDGKHSARVVVLEASDHVGGRVQNAAPDIPIDMGGAWVWLPHQRIMSRLVKDELGLEFFDQPDDPSSSRVKGGAVAVADALAAPLLRSGAVKLNAPVSSIRRDEDTGLIHVQVARTTGGKGRVVTDQGSDQAKVKANDDDRGGGGGGGGGDGDEDGATCAQAQTWSLQSRNVVLALPPRLAALKVEFSPPLPRGHLESMLRAHTWMAGVTKVALVFPKRLWPLGSASNGGLRGRPAFQFYDASTADDSLVVALTFFTLDGSGGVDDDDTLARACADQLHRHWASLGLGHLVEAGVAHSYSAVHVARWPQNLHISDDPSPTTIHPHPRPVPVLARAEWGGHLIFAGTETDQRSPGVMEGAVGSGLRAFQQLQDAGV